MSPDSVKHNAINQLSKQDIVNLFHGILANDPKNAKKLLNECILFAFDWSKSIEGEKFWNGVATAFEGKQLPVIDSGE